MRQRRQSVSRQVALLEREQAWLASHEAALVARLQRAGAVQAGDDHDDELDERLRQLAQLLVPGCTPRDFQLRAAAAAVQGRDVFVIEGAGSGKTLVMMLAGLALGGITVVFSPLIALASEQVAKANASNVGAVPLWGGETAVPLAYLVGGHGASDFAGALQPKRSKGR